MQKRLSAKVTGLAFLLASLIACSKQSPPAPPANYLPQPASTPKQAPFFFPCASGSAEKNYEIRGTILLNEEFLPQRGKSERAFRAGVLEQLRFLTGYFETVVDSDGQKIFLSSAPPKIKIASAKKVPYGLGLEIDRVPGDESEPYIKRALARGFSRPDDPGWLVSYIANVRIGACLIKPDLAIPSRSDLPSDPYLAYWLVPKAQRRQLASTKNTTAVNPCASLEITHLNFFHHYWWLYNPTAKGIDAAGKSFDCASTLRPSMELKEASFHELIGEKNKKFNLADPLLKKTGPLHATILFGPSKYLFNLSSELKFLSERLKSENSPEEISAVLKSNAQRTAQDAPESIQFLEFMGKLGEKISLVRESISAGENYLLVTWTGNLRESGKKIRLRTYFGSTEALGPLAGAHWPTLEHALAEDDLLLYYGRAGLGVNMSLASLSRAKGETGTRVRGPRYQLIGILATHAYSFFGRDIASARHLGNPQARTDLFLSATCTSPNPYLALFQYLDLRFAGKSVDWPQLLYPYAKESLYFLGDF